MTEQEVASKNTAQKVIDCDIHNSIADMNELVPYLSDTWKDFVRSSKMTFPIGGFPFFVPTGGGYRMDSFPKEGGAAGSSHELVKKHLLDEYNVTQAILFPNPGFLFSCLPQDQWATAVSAAYNDWLIDKWLSRDSRFKGSITVALQDPQSAAREIDRLGQHPGMVQIGLGAHSPFRGYGDQYYDPIWEAAVRNNLVVSLHVSIGLGLFQSNPAGSPKNFPEFQSTHSLIAQNQVASMIFGGVFDKFPDLKVVIIECGFAWVPHMMYTMDTHWKAARRDVPWVKRYPSEYVREHFWFGTQPMIKTPTPKEILQIIQMIGEDRLVFASDYPHWEFDSPYTSLNQLPNELQKKIIYDNANNLFKFNDE